MRFRDRNLKDIADCIVGDRQYFPYRSSFYITQFFDECDLPYVHDANKRSQIIFMDREDILNLFTVNLIEVPQLS